MNESKSLKAGARANNCSQVFLVVQVFLLYSLSCEYLAEGLGVFLSRIEQNVLILLGGVATARLDYLVLCAVYLLSTNVMGVGALVLALISFAFYKRKQSKATVIWCIVVLLVSCILILGSEVPLY
jgi:hypothetical protein